MSSLEQRLYQHEEQPPRESWDRIAAALDESDLSSKFPARLHEMEMVPPASAWDRIQSTLDPQAAENTLSQWLYSYEVVPPLNTWNTIAGELDQDMPETPVISLGRRMQPWVRYAAAAVLIAAVALGLVWFTGGEKGQGTLAVAPANQKPATSSVSELTNPASVPAPENVPVTETKKLVAKLDVPVKALFRKAANSRASRYAASDEMDQAQPIYAYADHVPNLADRYVMLMTPDGNIIRMSKKWSELVCCVSGAEQDPDCKDQLKKWQEKMATSPLAPSPGNFMDILNLVNSLNEQSEL